LSPRLPRSDRAQEKERVGDETAREMPSRLGHKPPKTRSTHPLHPPAEANVSTPLRAGCTPSRACVYTIMPKPDERMANCSYLLDRSKQPVRTEPPANQATAQLYKHPVFATKSDKESDRPPRNKRTPASLRDLRRRYNRPCLPTTYRELKPAVRA
jgi:hypothetical protein